MYIAIVTLILPSYIGKYINFAIVTKQEDYLLSITMAPCPVGARDLAIHQTSGSEWWSRKVE